MTSRGVNRLLLLVTVFLFSTGGAAIKLAHLSVWQIAAGRAAIAAVFLSLALPTARRGWSLRTFVCGLAYAATIILFVLSNRLTTSANAILLQATYSVYLLGLSPLILHERPRPSDFAVVAGVCIGALTISMGSEHAATAPDPARGNIVALCAGFTWALTLTALRWTARRDPQSDAGASVPIAGNLIACAVCLAPALTGPAPALKSLLVVAYLGIFQIGVAYVCLTKSFRHVPALDATMILLIEPVLNPFWTWLIHNEKPSALALTGGVVILISVLSGSVWKARALRP